MEKCITEYTSDPLIIRDAGQLIQALESNENIRSVSHHTCETIVSAVHSGLVVRIALTKNRKKVLIAFVHGDNHICVMVTPTKTIATVYDIRDTIVELANELTLQIEDTVAVRPQAITSEHISRNLREKKKRLKRPLHPDRWQKDYGRLVRSKRPQ